MTEESGAPASGPSKHKVLNLDLLMGPKATAQTSIGTVYLYSLRASDISEFRKLRADDPAERVREFLPCIASLSERSSFKEEREPLPTELAAQLTEADLDALGTAYASPTVLGAAREYHQCSLSERVGTTWKSACKPAQHLKYSVIRTVFNQITLWVRARLELGDSYSGAFAISMNPPFGVDWKKIEGDIADEHSLKGFDGRFGPGLPRVSDGSLLFLLHLISKLRDVKDGGSRIGIILNGSPLFTGGAGSGESEIRRYILEADLLEAIVALPTDMFYNTGIATYVWVLSNKKASERKGRVQLINGANLCGKMRKSLGSKRNQMDESDIATITRCFGDFEVVDARELDKPAEQKSNRGRQSANPKTEAPKTFASKIFASHEFGYRRITIERPLRLSWQFSDERIAGLRFESGALNGAMQWIYAEYGQDRGQAQWRDAPDCPTYGELTAHTDAIRIHLKRHFADLKEKQIKDLLDRETWLSQKRVLLKARQLQHAIGVAQSDDFNAYDDALKVACKKAGITLETKEKKQIGDAVSWKNPAAEKVIKKLHKDKKAHAATPLYGLFAVGKEVVEYQTDGDLRDFENIALDPSRSVNEINEAYFIKEVQPHVPDAWIAADKRDTKDGEIGIVGYEIPFNRHFYQYQPPRPLEEIDADLDAVSKEIMDLLREVHS